ncbi:MAG: ATP-dependent zinc protease [Okeania sp. SIO2D1]|nr:ATP-dependent zinc protease [Okeania sp. SIO2D1]
MNERSLNQLPLIGWREYLNLPELRVSQIKAKIDTGARSSALHAFEIETFEEAGRQKVRFKIHPLQKDDSQTICAQADILTRREVRNSGGKAELRIFIETIVELGGQRWPVEMTLTNRDVMGFRMLLGRQAVRQRFLVDPGGSYLQSGQVDNI